MKQLGRGCLVVVGALIAFSGQTIGPATPAAEAAPRESRSLFPFRLPWQQAAKPVRRPRRAAKPAPPKPASVQEPMVRESAAAAPGVPLPRPAPEPKTEVAAVPQRAPRAPEPESPRAAAPETAEPETTRAAPTPEPGPASAVESLPAESEAASAGRAADFAALRPAPIPEPPPLAPLPSEPDLVPPKGRIAYGVPLPPMKASLQEPPAMPEPAPAPAAPGPQIAMTPRAPLNGPPLPGPPDADTPPPVVAPAPSARDSDPDCTALKAENVAIATALPPLLGPESCGAPLPVELTGVRLKDGSTVEIKPAAILRCAMARAVAAYVREDLAPAAEKVGPALTRLQTAASYVCRGRNNRVNAKMSEHGLANALDISGFEFKGGKDFGVYAKDLPQAFSVAVKTAACDRFNTVLGPGSDGFHEDHLHVDLRKRKSAGSKLCRWTAS